MVRLPAIADEAEAYRVETVLGQQSFGRREGEALHPARAPPEMLDQIRRTLGEYHFVGSTSRSPRRRYLPALTL